MYDVGTYHLNGFQVNMYYITGQAVERRVGYRT